MYWREKGPPGPNTSVPAEPPSCHSTAWRSKEPRWGGRHFWKRGTQPSEIDIMAPRHGWGGTRWSLKSLPSRHFMMLWLSWGATQVTEAGLSLFLPPLHVTMPCFPQQEPNPMLSTPPRQPVGCPPLGGLSQANASCQDLPTTTRAVRRSDDGNTLVVGC